LAVPDNAAPADKRPADWAVARPTVAVRAWGRGRPAVLTAPAVGLCGSPCRSARCSSGSDSSQKY